MLNCDSRDRAWTTIDEIRTHLNEKIDFAHIEAGLKNSQQMYAAGILFRKNKRWYLVQGNSRLLGCRDLHLRPKVVAI